VHHLGRRRNPRLEVLGPARDAAHPFAAGLERVEEPTADVPGGAGEQDQSFGRDGTRVDANLTRR
jgi:hypothetical protein